MKPVKYTLLYSSVLIVSVGLAFFWTRSLSLTVYSLQLISFLVIVYMFLQFISRKVAIAKTTKVIADVALLTLVTYIIVFSTGSLFSPLFFLIYYLLFGIALLFEPSSAVSLALISTVFFLFTPRKEIFQEILQLVSLFLITPLALIFGAQYIQLLQSKEKIKVLATKDRQLEKEVREQEVEVKSWTEGEFKGRLVRIWNSVENLVNSPACQDTHKQKLGEISKQISSLLESGEKMQEKIEE